MCRITCVISDVGRCTYKGVSTFASLCMRTLPIQFALTINLAKKKARIYVTEKIYMTWLNTGL
jgi:hypothetical protein